MAETQGKIVPIRAQHIPLPAGDAGVALTIGHMMRDILGPEGAMHPTVRQWALAATRDCPDRDDRSQASAIYRAVKHNIRFRGEYSETVQTPLVTLQLQAGDCDDHATLIAALLRSIGIPARLETVSTDSTQEFTHVFALAGMRHAGRIVAWLPMDTTVSGAFPGWRPPAVTRQKVWGGRVLGNLAEDGPQTQTETQITGKAAKTVQIINTAADQARNVIDALARFKNRNTTGTLDFRQVEGGYGASVGVSPTMLAVGGAVALGAIGLLMMRRR